MTRRQGTHTHTERVGVGFDVLQMSFSEVSSQQPVVRIIHTAATHTRDRCIDAAAVLFECVCAFHARYYAMGPNTLLTMQRAAYNAAAFNLQFITAQSLLSLYMHRFVSTRSHDPWHSTTSSSIIKLLYIYARIHTNAADISHHRQFPPKCVYKQLFNYTRDDYCRHKIMKKKSQIMYCRTIWTR